MSDQTQDWESGHQKRCRHNRQRARLFAASRMLFCLFLVVFCISSCLLIGRTYRGWKEEKAFSDLHSLIQNPSSDDSDSDSPDPSNPDSDDDVPATAGTSFHPEHPQFDENGVLVKYSKVYARNPDLYGWISIDGTELNYPVMRTPEDEEFYLRRDFDKKYSRSGVPFIDVDCTPEGMNHIVYGHNMLNGTMFSLLESYQHEDFWREHPVIHFDTIYEEAEYEVMAAFYTRVFNQNETDVFRYYYYEDLSDPQDYEDYVNWMSNMSQIDTGIEAEYGDDLLTLITCSYGFEAQRFVVLARKCK